MSDLFVLTGAPGSGKTPIIRALVGLGFSGVAEPAREVIAEQRALGSNGVYDKDPALFLRLMLARAIDTFRSAADATSPMFFDRGIPDMVAYAELFELDPSAAEEAAGAHRYSETVFFCPSWPEIYTTDDERRMTLEEADAFGQRIREVYAALGYTIADVPRGTPTQRAAFIANATA